MFNSCYQLKEIEGELIVYANIFCLVVQLFYCFGIVEDLIFRCVWTLNISVGDAGASILEGLYLGTILGVVEVGRRFFWNFFRVENEHLNNCGQFRVIRDISVHPIDLRDLGTNEEEGVEPAQRKNVREVQRKMSVALQEVSGLEVLEELSSLSLCFYNKPLQLLKVVS